MARQVAYGEATVRDEDGALVSRATGTFLLHRPDPTRPPRRLTRPCPGRRARASAASVAARRASYARRLLRLPDGGAPARAAVGTGASRCACARSRARSTRLHGLQGVAGGRGPAALRRHGRARSLHLLRGARAVLAAAAGWRRRPGPAGPLVRPPRRRPSRRWPRGCGRWSPPPWRPRRAGCPRLLGASARRSGTCSPHIAAPSPCLPSGGTDGRRRSRVLLLDDTYVSGARSQSAAAALRLAGARAVVIVAARPRAAARTGRRCTPPSSSGTGGAGRPAGRRLRRAAAAFRPGRGRSSAHRSAPRKPPRARRRSAAVSGAPRGRATRGGPKSPKSVAGPMNCPERTDDEVAAHRMGRAPAGGGLSERGPGGPSELAPDPARPRAPHRCRPGCSGSSPGWAATARVGSPAAAQAPARARR